MVRLIYFTLILLIALPLEAQKIDAFATARVNTRRVVIEQPVKVNVKAYSSTWFAEPLTFKNLTVEGAFVQSFRRTQSSIEYINGKKYAALEFYYILFPYQSGEIVFPELQLTTSIPPENDYKGKPVTLKTQPITLTIDPAPEEADPNRWLVASNAQISNEWSGDINNLKVGDVITRTITTIANGTLPTFIDEPLVESIDFGSIYPYEAQFFDERDNKSVNGRRVDTYAYLLEQTGEFQIPEVELTWWNPYMGRFYKRKLPPYTFMVHPNEDMAALQLLKDSLQALNPAFQDVGQEPEKAKFETYLRYLVMALMIGVLLLVLIKMGWRIRTWIKEKRVRYKTSERYWFNEMLKQVSKRKFINSIYLWANQLSVQPRRRTFKDVASGDHELQQQLLRLNQSVYSSKGASDDNSLNNIKKRLKDQRKKMTKKEESNQSSGLSDLNP